MKIAIVVQRYGLQINGGAELHARQLAEQLSKKHNVSIFTSKSESYIEWGNYYKDDIETINNIKVYRFNTENKKRRRAKIFYRILRDFSKISIRLRKRGYNKLADSNLLTSKIIFKKWLRYQGPYCPGLPKKIEELQNDFDVFIFFTYLYYPTNAGLFKVANKSIFIPTAHDEKPFYFPNYKFLFEKTAFIMYNSQSEKKLVENTYPKSKNTNNDIAGVGIDFPEFKIEDAPIDIPYFVYIGRIDTSKNVHELIEWFNKYATNKDVKLVLIGKNDNQSFDSGDNIIFTGFISDQEKNNWLYHSKALIIPSKFESLSMVTLEAMNMSIPVIANAYCDVLADHIKISKAGYAYQNYEHFTQILDDILKMPDDKRKLIGENGKKYVADNYQWDKILEKFENAFQYLTK